MKNNELQNLDNYFKIIIENEVEIYTKYTNIIIQYLLLGIELNDELLLNLSVNNRSLWKWVDQNSHLGANNF